MPDARFTMVRKKVTASALTSKHMSSGLNMNHVVTADIARLLDV